MNHLLLAILFICTSLASTAQATYPRHRAHYGTAAARRAASPKVYVCGGGSAYAYHSSGNCNGLSRCSHGISAVTVAEGMGRRPCKKCY